MENIYLVRDYFCFAPVRDSMIKLLENLQDPPLVVLVGSILSWSETAELILQSPVSVDHLLENWHLQGTRWRIMPTLS